VRIDTITRTHAQPVIFGFIIGADLFSTCIVIFQSLAALPHFRGFYTSPSSARSMLSPDLVLSSSSTICALLGYPVFVSKS